MEGALTILLVIGLCVWGLISSRNQRREDADHGVAEFVERQALVRRLLTGDEPDLFRRQFGPDGSLRAAQLIGESMSIATTTTNEGTRASRLHVIRSTVEHQAEQGWPGLTPETVQAIESAVDFNEQRCHLLAALARVDKHHRAEARATRPETKRKYSQLALDEITAARAGLHDARLQRIADNAIASLTARPSQ